MNDNPLQQEINDTFKRWFDTSDIPENVDQEMLYLATGLAYILFVTNESHENKIYAILEAFNCIFNLGRAYGHPDLLKGD